MKVRIFFFDQQKLNNMLPYPFFRSEKYEFFTDFIKNSDSIFTIFEPECIGREIEFLHHRKGNLFGKITKNITVLDEVLKILNEIKSGTIKPVYFFMGEEPYYIDKLTEYIEDNLLPEEDKGFNQMVLYGKDVSMDDVISNAKRYPMMADRQLVIVKEAQELSRQIDKLEAYVKNPQPTTVLVFAYKYKTLDKRKSITKLIGKTGVVFESKKLYETS